MLTLMLMAVSASAKLPLDKYSVNRNDLPQAAREMLDKYFPKAKVSMVKVDRHFLKRTDYDVKLTNGTKIEFSNKGRWTHVDCKRGVCPKSLCQKPYATACQRNTPRIRLCASADRPSTTP